jgi:hypothetical protein
MDNKNKIDRIHDEMPRFFKTRANPNWKALIEALGESDQNLSDLIEEVKKQFFVKTASRPYIDRLGANHRISRPRFVGMDDITFRNYIPVLAYQPKQVKLVLDLLLDIFFFKETTTAFTQSGAFEPFRLLDGWEINYTVDQTKFETIMFKSDNFIDINNATAEEIASAINRQAQYSFAIVFDDRIQKNKYIRIFSNTIGSKGSIQITGGRANIAMQFRGYNSVSGSGSNTQWSVTKVGDTVTFQHVGGTTPNLDKIQIADVAIMSIPGNEGSFIIEAIDLAANSFSFTNLFATPGAFDHSLMSTDAKVRFITPEKMVVYINNTRSVVWEVSPGEIIVEMPASPPVVKRSLIGSAHINGMIEPVINRVSNTSLEIGDASEWPTQGQFILQELDEIQTHILTISEDENVSKQINTRFNKSHRYSYTSKTGDTLNGITPALPAASGIFEATIVSATRVGNTLTVVTSSAHGFEDYENVRLQGVSPDPDSTINNTFEIDDIISPTSFSVTSAGIAGVGLGGVARVERIGMANSGSEVYLTSSAVDSGILGPYMWSSDSPFVISSLTSNIQTEIKAGNNVRTVQINTINNIPNSEGFVVFDFGTEREEGPVRYLYKPTASSLQLDPAYVFKNNHDIGSSITVIRRRGAHVMSGLGTEYPAYITDPASAREILQDLMRQVKSVGIFIEFLIRYPQQVYNRLDVYRSGDTTLWPINDEEKAKLETL